MLADHYNIVYRHSDRTPIQLRISGNRLVIDCCFSYNRRALRLFRPLPEQTAADLIEAGIRQAWSGVYRLNLTGPEDEFPVFVQVVIHRDRRRRPVHICLKRLLIRPAHVISPVWRRIWGVFKTGQLESMGTNWAPTHPGKMILPIGLSPVTLRQIAAHEAGHLFGLGDAYGAVYRFYHGVQGKERYMMYSNQEVHPEEIVMLLNAHQTGRMQFFPRSWNTTRFVQGLRTDIANRITRLERRLAARRTKNRQAPQNSNRSSE
ncbi:MAG: hypothetical protein ACOX1U_07940 [Saccharofermentanales bacterium]|jgi:hypothetical protein